MDNKESLVTGSFIFIMTLNVGFAFGQTVADISVVPKCTIEIYLADRYDEIDSTRQCRYCFSPAIDGLGDTPFIGNDEIIGYRIEEDNHYLLLSESCQKKLQSLTKKSNTFPIRTGFAMVIDGEIVYGGWFLSRHVSNFHACDWIYVFTPFDGQELVIQLKHPLPAPKEYETDPRNNELVLDCLNKSNRFKRD